MNIRDINSLEQAKEKLREMEHHYCFLFEQSNDAVFLLDLEGRHMMANRKAADLFGYTNEELLQLSFKDLSAEVEKSEEVLRRLLAGEKIPVYERIFRQKNGEKIFMETNVQLVCDPDGKPLHIQSILRDITGRRQAEEALKHSEEKYRNILDSMEDGYYELSPGGDIVFSNRGAAAMLGYTLEDFIGMNFRELCRSEETAKDFFYIENVSEKPAKMVTIELVGKEGSIVYVEMSLSASQNEKGEITGFKAVGRNVTERKRFEEQLQYLSLHDQLTGLYNRAYFENELERLDGSREYPITVISMDLNGLKLINDTMGHAEGDELLKTCAAVTKRALRRSDILCRVGGDEFAIILPKTNEEAASKITGRIAYQVEQYNVKTTNLPLSISVGTATAGSPDAPLVQIYKKADDLMYRDKMFRGAGVRSQIINTLLTALSERDFVTEGHTQRLGLLCRKMGKKVGLSPQQLADLLLLAQVHDLGKVGVPDHVLFKPGTLTEEEWEVMRLHAEKGYRIASASPDLSGIADLILKHHERWDGEGYPLGLQGDDIPIECRIFAIIDAYDAMTHDRCYSSAISKEEALAELKRCAGTHFDPGLVEIFLETVA